MTEDAKVFLTAQQLETLRKLQLSDDRGGFYIQLHQYDPKEIYFLMGQISQFSGFAGGVAEGANKFVSIHDNYPSEDIGGVYLFSHQVTASVFQAVENAFDAKDPMPSTEEILKAARGAWEENYQMGSHFPGNLNLGWDALLKGNFADAKEYLVSWGTAATFVAVTTNTATFGLKWGHNSWEFLQEHQDYDYKTTDDLKVGYFVEKASGRTVYLEKTGVREIQGSKVVLGTSSQDLAAKFKIPASRFQEMPKIVADADNFATPGQTAFIILPAETAAEQRAVAITNTMQTLDQQMQLTMEVTGKQCAGALGSMLEKAAKGSATQMPQEMLAVANKATESIGAAHATQMEGISAELGLIVADKEGESLQQAVQAVLVRHRAVLAEAGKQAMAACVIEGQEVLAGIVPEEAREDKEQEHASHFEAAFAAAAMINGDKPGGGGGNPPSGGSGSGSSSHSQTPPPTGGAGGSRANNPPPENKAPPLNAPRFAYMPYQPFHSATFPTFNMFGSNYQPAWDNEWINRIGSNSQSYGYKVKSGDARHAGTSVNNLLNRPENSFLLARPYQEMFQPQRGDMLTIGARSQNSQLFASNYEQSWLFNSASDNSFFLRNPSFASYTTTGELASSSAYHSLYMPRESNYRSLVDNWRVRFSEGSFNQPQAASSSQIISHALRFVSSYGSLQNLYSLIERSLAGEGYGSPGITAFGSILSSSSTFVSALISTRLSSSYNTYHRHAQVNGLLQEFFGSAIGGVATEPGIIKNIIDSPDSVLFDEIRVAMAGDDAVAPFTAEELRQITMALYKGIYEQQTYPFFSLHFNNDGSLYPVIHPAYEGTIVGEVIAYLDYYMKGYLNGGVYPQHVLEEWHKTGNMDRNYLKGLLIDIKKESVKLGIPYQSLRELTYLYGIEKPPEAEVSENSTASHKYMTSFRILSEMKEVKHDGNVFLIEPSFRVEYTLDLNPDYKEYINKYHLEHGDYPEDYEKLHFLYQKMKHSIEQAMPSFSFAKGLFAKLGVITFISYYFTTLKAQGKVPVLDVPQDRISKPFPKAFPPLPVNYFEVWQLKITLGTVLDEVKSIELGVSLEQTLNQFLSNLYGEPETNAPAALITTFKTALQNIYRPQLPSHVVLPEIWLDSKALEVINLFLPVVHVVDEIDFIDFMEKVSKTFEDYSEQIMALISVEEFLQLPSFEQKSAYVAVFMQSVRNLLTTALDIKCSKARAEQEVEFNRQIQELRNTNSLPSDLDTQLNTLRNKLNEGCQKIKQSFMNALDSYNEQRLIYEKVPEQLVDWIKVKFNTTMEIPVTYKNLVTSIADGAYLQSAGTDLRVVGGVGVQLPTIEAGMLSHSLASVIRQGEKQSEKIAVVKNGSNYLYSFKILTKTNFVSSPFDYPINNPEDYYKTGPVTDLDKFLQLLKGENLVECEAFLAKDMSLLHAKDLRGYVPLMHMAEHGSIKMVNWLVSKGAEPNIFAPNGLTATMLATLNRKAEVATLLVNLPQTNLALEIDTHETVLHMAIQMQLDEVASACIARGSPLNISRLGDGYNLIQQAVSLGKDKLVEAMIKIQPSLLDSLLPSQKTLLHLAVVSGSLPTVQVLISNGANHLAQDADANTPLMQAILSNHLGICEYLSNLSFQSVTNRYGETAGCLAAKHRLFDLAQRLTKLGDNPNQPDNNGYSHSYYLLKYGELFHFKAMVEKGTVKVDHLYGGVSGLYIAVKHGHHLLTSYLVSKSAKFISAQPNEDSYSLAIIAEDVGYLRYQLNNKGIYDYIFSSVNMRALLNVAAVSGSEACFKELWGRVSPTQRSEIHEGQTLIEAVMQGANLRTLSFVLKCIVKGELIISGPSAELVHLAVINGFEDSLPLLHEYGYSFLSVNKYRKTPYHVAIDYDDKPMLNALLSLTYKQHIPLDIRNYAQTKGKPKTLKLLQEKEYAALKWVNAINYQDEKQPSSKAHDPLAVLAAGDDVALSTLLISLIKEGNIIALTKLMQKGLNLAIKIGKNDLFALAVELGAVEVIVFLRDLPNSPWENKLNTYSKLTKSPLLTALINKEDSQLEWAKMGLLRAIERSDFRFIKKVVPAKRASEYLG